MKNAYEILTALGLSRSETETYLAMTQGAASAREIVKVTRQKRPTVYYALNALWQKGLVSKTGSGKESGFRVEPVSSLKHLAEKKVQQASELLKSTEGLVLSRETGETIDRPGVSFFEGVEAIKMRIMYTLYAREKFIYSIVPRINFFWQIGESFVKEYVEGRIKREIKTRNLWEHRPEKRYMDKYYRELSRVRILPKEIQGVFTTTVFFYDTKTLYISPKKDAYCILVDSKEHFAMMKALFEGIWKNSEDYP